MPHFYHFYDERIRVFIFISDESSKFSCKPTGTAWSIPECVIVATKIGTFSLCSHLPVPTEQRLTCNFGTKKKQNSLENDDENTKFKKGGKGTLYIPAFLAYDQSPGPGHKPYENLIFDVEIADVTDAPKQSNAPAMPQMPQMPQQQGRPQQQQPHK